MKNILLVLLLSMSVEYVCVRAAESIVEETGESKRVEGQHLLSKLHEISRQAKEAELCKVLEDDQIDVNYCYPRDAGRTLLHFAVANNYLKFAELLLARGAKVNVVHVASGNTPLHAARTQAMFELLVKHGADKTIVNMFGKTPCDMHYRMPSINYLHDLSASTAKSEINS